MTNTRKGEWNNIKKGNKNSSRKLSFLFRFNLQVYCFMREDQGWTLIARFSNADGDNWKLIRPSDSFSMGNWWQYDKDDTEGRGSTTNPSDKDDMISPAFWLVSGYELMITRNDDPYTALLQTKDSCLGGQTFRSKIKLTLDQWQNLKQEHCHMGSCHVEYGGNYQNTEGFKQAKNCPMGFQSRDKIGFWCRYENRNGAVMMIGGGGKHCSEADHGIGIRDDDDARDFGNEADQQKLPTDRYSLNLWIR